MKTIRRMAWVLAAAALAVSCGRRGGEPARSAGPAPGSEARPVAGEAKDLPPPVCEDALASVFFISAATLPAGAAAPAPGAAIGFAAGVNNTLLKTADGGRSWRRVLERQPRGPEFAQVLFTSPAEGWAVSRDLLLHTANTGETWAACAKLPGNFYYFGPCAGGASAYYQLQPPTYGAAVHLTRDGGRTWQPLAAALPRNDYAAVCFLDEARGWLCNRGGVALTTDGGAAWQSVAIPNAGDLAQIHFVNPERGWARPRSEHAGGIWSTRDGGLSWRAQSAGVPDSSVLADLQFLDADTGFLLVDDGADGSRLLRSDDGGATWQPAAALPPGMAAISFVSATEGWAAGTGGRVVHVTL